MGSRGVFGRAAAAALAVCVLTPLAQARAESVTDVVNDPLASHQWGLDMIKAPAAWARGARGAGVIVAMVDSGIDLGHPDLAPKLVDGTDLIDGGLPDDENGHGTHTAGIVGAITNNGIGVAGTAPDALLMPVRVLDANNASLGGSISAGIRWAADHGARVINLSLETIEVGPPVPGGIPLSGVAEADVQYAWDRGAVVVAAAGNHPLPICGYPAAATKAICVAAVQRNGLPAPYSSFPNNVSGNTGVRAPGGLASPFCEDDEDIWSTELRAINNCGPSNYITGAGTSQAVPFVSGIAAMLAAKGLGNAAIVDRIKATASLHGQTDPVMGYGIVDADAATAGL